jgi:hypothetical protein
MDQSRRDYPRASARTKCIPVMLLSSRHCPHFGHYCTPRFSYGQKAVVCFAAK